MIPRPTNTGLKSMTNGIAMPARPGLQEAVAEQREAVDGDRDQGGERGLLVDRDERSSAWRRAAEAGGERQADQDGRGDERRARRRPRSG